MPHSTAPSLYRSPQEAMQAPPEEFLYLACLHEGTGVDAPDFLAVVDTEDGRIVHETADAERPATSSTTSAGTAARPPATAPTART